MHAACLALRMRIRVLLDALSINHKCTVLKGANACCGRLRGFLTVFSFIFLFAVFFALVIGFMWCELIT